MDWIARYVHWTLMAPGAARWKQVWFDLTFIVTPEDKSATAASYWCQLTASSIARENAANLVPTPNTQEDLPPDWTPNLTRLHEVSLGARDARVSWLVY